MFGFSNSFLKGVRERNMSELEYHIPPSLFLKIINTLSTFLSSKLKKYKR